ncbi:hypothetical protein KP79_PYT23845 [Mizuhopecten yessoensis]|uniref:Uncharacterized protein n=1 Tax=Mizuhopecten yessoensis TaxID=6573 RepID=A0A210Q7B0_MIZYE|nr:hypothetical protein KP79_PYT23845 [Mizuhopecten yessoensis]
MDHRSNHSTLKEAMKLNQTLKYVNEHQKCLIGRDREVISSLEVRLLEANKRLQDKPSVSTESQLKLDVAQLTQKLDGRNTAVETLEKEVEELKSRCKETLAKLQDSYTLIERHLANASSHRDEAGILREDKEDLEKKCEALKVALDSTQRELDIQTSLHRQAAEQWNVKSAETALEIERLTADLALSSKNCQQLEELNSDWAKHNLQLSTSLQEAKAKLDVPKSDTEVQTIVSLFEVEDVSCQTSVEVVTVPSQTETQITHPAHTQTFSPALTTNHTQTTYTSHQVASTQTRVAAVANTGVMATTDMADRGVQTLPVRVYQDFTDKLNDPTKDTGEHRKEPSDRSRGRIKMQNDPHIDQSVLTTNSDIMSINKGSEIDGSQEVVQYTSRDHIEDERVDSSRDNTVDNDLNQERQDITSTPERETSTLDASITLVQDISEDGQYGSLLVDADLNENLAEEVTKNSSLTSRVSRPPKEDEHAHSNVDGSQASSSSRYRPQLLTLEERLKGNFPQESVKMAAVDVTPSEKPEVFDEIIEINSPESPDNPDIVSTETNGDSDSTVQDNVVLENPSNSTLISSYRGFGQQAKEAQGKESEGCIQDSPRYSPLSLSLRKPRTQAKRSSIGDLGPVEESSMSAKKQQRNRGKFTLSSDKSGLLFEGKTLLSAYIASRSSTGVATKQTSPENVTDKRQATSRGVAAGRQTGQKSLTDARQTRYSHVAETRETCMDTDKPGQTRSSGRMTGADKMESKKTPSSYVTYPGQTDTSGIGMTEESGKLSPYSRYSAMFRARVVQTESVKPSKASSQEGNMQNEGQTETEQTDPGKSCEYVRGILKGVRERRINTKSVSFVEGPPQTQIIQECSGDQSLFSDSEEDAICEDNDRFVSLEEFQTSEDSSEAKRRKLE